MAWKSLKQGFAHSVFDRNFIYNIRDFSRTKINAILIFGLSVFLFIEIISPNIGILKIAILNKNLLETNSKF